MGYDYSTQREQLFTEKGQRLFIAYRDKVNKLLDEAGAYMSGRVGLPPGIGAADGWDLMACDDRLVELGETRELTSPESWGQHRVFIRARRLMDPRYTREALNAQAIAAGWKPPMPSSDFATWCFQTLVGVQSDGLAGPQTFALMRRVLKGTF